MSGRSRRRTEPERGMISVQTQSSRNRMKPLRCVDGPSLRTAIAADLSLSLPQRPGPNGFKTDPVKRTTAVTSQDSLSASALALVHPSDTVASEQGGTGTSQHLK